MKLSVTVYLLFMSIIGSSQHKFSFESNIYFSSYKMNDLKGTTMLIRDSSPEGSKIVSNFPPYSSYSVILYKNYLKVKIGLWSGYQTTGSRVSLADYSGQLNSDLLVSGYGVGLAFQTFKEGTPLALSLRTGYIFNNIRINKKLKSDQMSYNTSEKFKSFNIPIILGLSYKKAIFKGLDLNFGFSYDFSSLGNDIHLSSDKKIYLYKKYDGIYRNYKGNAKVDWSGFRLGIGLGLNFKES